MNELEWKGYSFDELKYQRALTTIKCEIEKEKLMAVLAAFKSHKLPVIGNFKEHSFLGKILGALDFADYSYLAFKIGRKLFTIIKNRRKN